MARKGYSTVALPRVIIDRVDEVIKNKRNAYISRPEFIKECIREKLKRMES